MFTAPPDNFFQRTWAHHQPVCVLRPEAITLDELAEVSSIVSTEGYSKSRWKLLHRLLRIPYRLWASAARWAQNRRNLRRLRSVAQAL